MTPAGWPAGDIRRWPDGPLWSPAPTAGRPLAVEPLDLADLGSVRELAARLATSDQPVDVLVNNAGIVLLSRIGGHK